MMKIVKTFLADGIASQQGKGIIVNLGIHSAYGASYPVTIENLAIIILLDLEEEDLNNTYLYEVTRLAPSSESVLLHKGKFKLTNDMYEDYRDTFIVATNLGPQSFNELGIWTFTTGIKRKDNTDDDPAYPMYSSLDACTLFETRLKVTLRPVIERPKLVLPDSFSKN